MPEIVTCPKCERKLRVPDDLLGKPVKCPTCEATFTAEAAGGAVPGPAIREESPPYRREEDEPYQPAPRPRRDRRDDYDDDYDDRPRRRRRPRADSEPHRGTMILVFGILSIVICGLFGPVAWVMGNTDLAEMRSGRMDPEGEGLTNAGRICGIIGTILLVVGLICGVLYVILLVGMFGAAGGAKVR
jgi:hypothetical protein